MSEFHDPELRQELGRLSGPYPDDNAAFSAWQRRVAQVRRRRAVAWTTTAALALVIGTIAIAAVQSPGRHTVVPGKSADSSADVTSSIASTKEKESSTVPEDTERETSAPTILAPRETTPIVIDTSVAETAAPEAAGAPSNGSGSSSSSSSDGRSTTPSSPAPQGPQLTTQTFSSVGGSITVRQEGDRLTVIANSPATGFKAKESNGSGEKVEVTFKAGGHTSEITVKVSDGVMDGDVNESGDEDDDDSAPPRTTEGDGDDDRDSDGGDKDRKD